MTVGEREEVGERDAGKEGDCIILSAGDKRGAGEEKSDVISAWCKEG